MTEWMYGWTPIDELTEREAQSLRQELETFLLRYRRTMPEVRVVLGYFGHRPQVDSTWKIVVQNPTEVPSDRRAMISGFCEGFLSSRGLVRDVVCPTRTQEAGVSTPCSNIPASSQSSCDPPPAGGSGDGSPPQPGASGTSPSAGET